MVVVYVLGPPTDSNSSKKIKKKFQPTIYVSVQRYPSLIIWHKVFYQQLNPIISDNRKPRRSN